MSSNGVVPAASTSSGFVVKLVEHRLDVEQHALEPVGVRGGQAERADARDLVTHCGNERVLHEGIDLVGCRRLPELDTHRRDQLGLLVADRVRLGDEVALGRRGRLDVVAAPRQKWGEEHDGDQRYPLTESVTGRDTSSKKS